jgi:RND family efflux transporter MFP subunit
MLAGAAVAIWLTASATQAQGPAPGSEVLRIAAVAYREVDLTYSAEATVEAVKQATIAAQVQGRVIDVRVDAGDRVKLGDLLMRIDEREATQAVAASDAQVAQAKANLANARATYERTKNLYARKFVSSAALDQAESAHKAAQAQLDAALAGRGQALTGRSFTTITSPLSGLVAQRHAELGEMAMPGKALITLYDPKALRVVAEVPQYKVAEVGKNLRAKVEFPETGKWIEARPVVLLPTADLRSHTVRARVTLPEGIQGAVPGMYARVRFVLGTAKKILVPAAALARRGEVTGVYVVDAGGVPSMRQVRLGEPIDTGEVEVLAGLNPGEQVALHPAEAGIRLRQAGMR